jgi:hypothetical protein
VWKPGIADYAIVRVAGRNHAGFFARKVAAPHWLVYFVVDDAEPLGRSLWLAASPFDDATAELLCLGVGHV